MDHCLRRSSARSRLHLLVLFGILFFVLLPVALFTSHERIPKVREIVTSLPKFQFSHCNAILIPKGLDTKGPILQKWYQLQALFDSHAPLLKPHPDSLETPSNQSSPIEIKIRLPENAIEAGVLRSIHADLIKNIPPMPEGLYRGRGVVMVAGGGKPEWGVVGGGEKSEFAATSLGMLRLLGSQIPVELWFLKPQDAKAGWCRQLAAEGVACRFLSDYVPDATIALPFEGQQITAAILFSSFEHVLYLDSDTIPVANIDSIFDSQPYWLAGSVVWPDFWESSETEWAGYILGTRAEPDRFYHNYGTIDAAQMIWNKSRHWQTLMLAAYYNHHTPFYHSLINGIPSRGFASTFQVALRALKLPFYSTPHFLSPVAQNTGDGTDGGGGVSVLQADPANSLMFSPVFMHTSIVRFGLHDLMCDKCVEDIPEGHGRPGWRQRVIGTKVRTMGAIATRSDGSYNHLNTNQRLLSANSLHAKGIDPEIQLWKVLERLSCEKDNAWQHDSLCTNVRTYIHGTFGEVEPWRGGCKSGFSVLSHDE